jgi:hypothetical protein
MKVQTPAAHVGSTKPDGDYNRLARNADIVRLAGELLILALLAGAAVISFMIDDPGPLPLPFGGTIDIPTELSGALGGTHGLVNAHGFLEQSRLLPRDNHALALVTFPMLLSAILGVLTRRWLPVVSSVICLVAITLLVTGTPRLLGVQALNLLVLFSGVRFALNKRSLKVALCTLLAFACLNTIPFVLHSENTQRKQRVQSAIIAEKSAMKLDLPRALTNDVVKSNDKLAPSVNYVLAQLAYHFHSREAAQLFVRKLEPSAAALTPHSTSRIEEIRGFASQSATEAARADDNYSAFWVVAVATALVIALSLLLKGQADAILRRIERLRSSAAWLGARRSAPRSSVDEASLDKLKLREFAIRRAAFGCLAFAIVSVFVAAKGGYHLYWPSGAITEIPLSSYTHDVLHKAVGHVLLFRRPIPYVGFICVAALIGSLIWLIYTIVKKKRRAVIPFVAAIGIVFAHAQYYSQFDQGVLPMGSLGLAHIDPRSQIDIEQIGKHAEAETQSPFWKASIHRKIVAAEVHFAVAQFAYQRGKPAVGAYHFEQFAKLNPDGDGFSTQTIIRIHTWLRESGHVVDLPLRAIWVRKYHAASTTALLHLLMSIPGWLFGLVGLVLAEMIRRNHSRIETAVRAEVSIDRVQNWLASRNEDRLKDAKPIL